MGIFKSESKQAIEDHQANRDELERVSKRDRAETDDYVAANSKVHESAERVSWFLR